jgi:hypothetical protein
VLAFAAAAAALSPRSPPPASREPEVLAVARHRRALQSGNSPLPLGGRPGGAVDSARGATPKSDSQLSYRNPPQNHDCENVDMPAAVTPIVHVTDTACVAQLLTAASDHTTATAVVGQLTQRRAVPRVCALQDLAAKQVAELGAQAPAGAQRFAGIHAGAEWAASANVDGGGAAGGGGTQAQARARSVR